MRLRAAPAQRRVLLFLLLLAGALWLWAAGKRSRLL